MTADLAVILAEIKPFIGRRCRPIIQRPAVYFEILRLHGDLQISRASSGNEVNEVGNSGPPGASLLTWRLMQIAGVG